MSAKVGWLERLLCKFLPYRDITKTVDGQEVLYLRRFFLWRSDKRDQYGDDGSALFLHVIHRSDDDRDPHDHPWDFSTFVLKGGYDDEQWVWHPPFPTSHGIAIPGMRQLMGYEPVNRLGFKRRAAEHIHRVRLRDEKTAWTLVRAGKKRRRWGFVTETGWKHFKEYLGIP